MNDLNLDLAESRRLPPSESSYLANPTADGRSCIWSPATTILLARCIAGTPLSRNICEASSNTRRSNIPASSGSASETASGVISQTRTPPSISYPNLLTNLPGLHLLLEEAMRDMSPNLLDSLIRPRASCRRDSASPRTASRFADMAASALASESSNDSMPEGSNVSSNMAACSASTSPNIPASASVRLVPSSAETSSIPFP